MLALLVALNFGISWLSLDLGLRRADGEDAEDTPYAADVIAVHGGQG